MDVTVRAGEHELAGVVEPGESWATAARRVSGAPGPEPLDLSGAVKRFVVDPDVRVAVREATRGDLGDLGAWRRSEAVQRWWSPGEIRTEAELEATYAERVEGRSPTRMWVVEVNGRSVGFVQDYRLRDYPDYALLCPDPDAVGLDYAIGADEWRGRGLGARVLWAWALRARARFPDVASFFAAPDHRNAASLRVLAKTGFAAGLWFDAPEGDGSVHTVVGCTFDVATVLGAPRR